jgi:hypothetical protein
MPKDNNPELEIDDNDLDLDLDLEDIGLDELDMDGDDETVVAEQTAAAATIAAKPSRTATLANLVSAAANMSDEDLNHFAASIAQPTNPIDGGAAAKNKASIATKTVTKEELDSLFGDELSEDFRDQATTLFESAVNARVGLEAAALAEELEAKYTETTAALEEAYAATLEEEVSALTDGLYEQIDSYLNYAAGTWVADNEVAIDVSLRAEIAEDFMGKMKDLFLEHNLNIPDEAEDVLAEMLEVNEGLETELNAALEQIIALKEDKLVAGVESTFAEETVGLAATQIDRIRTLAEGIESDDLATYTKKLRQIKESVTKKAISEDQLIEEAAAPANVDPQVARYMDAISRTSRPK